MPMLLLFLTLFFSKEEMTSLPGLLRKKGKTKAGPGKI